MRKAGHKYYVLMISVHGLIRGDDLELGRDADTGGQSKYVVDLVRALAQREEIERVDLVTRRVVDPALSEDYAQSIEALGEKARIVRLDAGPDGYIPKEQLWDHLDSFTDNLLDWLSTQPRAPDVVHSHYADAGYVAVRLAGLMACPLVHTGHSLGRDKRKRLMARGLSRDQIERTYNMSRRVDAEEQVLASADLVITSTHNEIEQQYALYNYYDPVHMAVIPPGTDLHQFHPPDDNETAPLARQLERFLSEPGKPLILALSRPDERKNILTLIEAYGESRALQEAANLLIIAGTRDDIRDLDPGAQAVLTNILVLIDSYDLYGKIAVPKTHRAAEVPAIYRMVARSGGVFVNPALTEPFGLTLLEAAASGLPVVATENGGPVDIIGNCENGLLVDPLDKVAIGNALLQFLRDEGAWQRAAKNGIERVRQHYSWTAHADTYLKKIAGLTQKSPPLRPDAATQLYRNHALFTDLDQSLIGDPEALRRLIVLLRGNRSRISFGVATGRRIDTALAVMKKHGIPVPDILISSLGTRIHYGQDLTEDDYWSEHIDHHWSPQRIRRVLAEIPGLEPQPKTEQSAFKLSFFYDGSRAPAVDEIIGLIRQKELTANTIHSFGQFLDIVPARASKGQALRYVAQLLDIPLENILVAGGSGADEDMMRGNTRAVVVANRHHEELSQLVEQERIFFATRAYAGGILEAIEHYHFIAAPEGAGA